MLIRTLLLLILLAFAPRTQAAYSIGFSDNRCTVTFRTFEAGLFTNHGEAVHIHYDVACADGIKYSRDYYHEYSNNSCVPSDFNTSVKPTYNESAKSFTLRTNSGTNKTCADLYSPWLAADYTRRPFSTTPSKIQTWSAVSQAVSSTTTFAKYTSSKFKVETPYPKVHPGRSRAWNASKGRFEDKDKDIPALRWFAKVSYPTNPDYFALIYVLPGMDNDDYFDRPLVVGDAFDPLNGRGAYAIETKKEYANLFNDKSPRADGYDLFFLDFSQGGGDIHINAGIELKFIEWLGQKSGKKMIVGGPSMSGIVARLALLYAMPANNSQNANLAALVKGYLSIDSPQQGASIGTSLQQRMHLLKDNPVVKFGEFLGGGNDPAGNWTQLTVPAAHQMLYLHYYPNGNAPSGSHDAFYNFLGKIGRYNPNVPAVAIAYSNFYKPHTGYTIEKDADYVVGVIDPPAIDPKWLYSRNFDFEPGSTGDWYLSPFKNASPTYLTVTAAGTPSESFHGTFIPIRSALDLNAAFPLASPPANANEIAAYSPFFAIHYMQKTYTGYCNTSGTCQQIDLAGTARNSANDKRYQHIIFDTQVMDAINSSLATLEGVNNAKGIVGALTCFLH